MTGRRERPTAGGVASGHARRLADLERRLSSITKTAADPGGLYGTEATTGGTVYEFGSRCLGGDLNTTDDVVTWRSSDDSQFGSVTLPAGTWLVTATAYIELISGSSDLNMWIAVAGGDHITPAPFNVRATFKGDVTDVGELGVTLPFVAVATFATDTEIEMVIEQLGFPAQAQSIDYRVVALSVTLGTSNMDDTC